MFNKIILIGRLGQDPVLKDTKSGKKICQVSLATQEKKDTPPDWHNCVFFEKSAEILEKYCKKGGRISIDGRLSYKEYTNEAGEKKKLTQILVNKLTIIDFKDFNENENEKSENLFPF